MSTIDMAPAGRAPRRRCCVGLERASSDQVEGRSDGEGEFAERFGEAQLGRGFSGEFVVAAAKVLDEGVPGGDHCGGAEAFRLRIGRSRAFSRPWSVSIRLFAYCSVRCAAAGTSSSSTRRYGPALSVVTSTGAGPYFNAPVKKRRAAAVSRCSDSSTSMTWPYWSTAR